MGRLITLGYAAELMGCTTRSVLRASGQGKLRTVPSPGRHANKPRTMVDVDSLPEPAQEQWRSRFALARRPVALEARPPAMPSAPEPSAGASEARLPMARFRYAIIEPLVTGAWARALNTVLNGVAVNCKGDYVRGLAAARWTKPDGREAKYSESGIYALLRRFSHGGMAALATCTRSDRGETRLPRIVQDFALAAYCRGGFRQHADLYSLRAVMRLIDEERGKRAALHLEGRLLDYIHQRGEFAPAAGDGRGWAIYSTDAGEPQPSDFYLMPRASYSAVHRFLMSVPEPLKELSRRGLEAYKNHCERTIVRDYASLKCMEYVVFDHRRCDIFVALKKRGRWLLIRPWETVALDMRSRAVLASVMSVVPSSLTIASCIRQVVMRWGLFENAYFDNGKDFRSHYIDGDGAHEGAAWRQDWLASEFADTRGLLAKLGVRVTHAVPYSGRSKPIEPSFRNPAAFERSLSGACGNRPHNRPEALETLVAEFRQWMKGDRPEHPFMEWDKFRSTKEWFYYNDYNRRPHTGREMNGRSPEQVIREDYAGKGLARRVSARALDLLMQRRKIRTVGNGGTFAVSFAGKDYVYSAPELWLLQGRQLETGYDPEDLGEMVVYEPGAAYVCTATCVELRRMGEEQFREDIAEQRRLVKQTRKAAEQLQRMAAIPTVEERIAWSQRMSPEPLTLEGAPTTALLEERFESAAAAAAAGPVRHALAAESEEEQLTFLGSV